jgi:hypothetical protein
MSRFFFSAASDDDFAELSLDSILRRSSDILYRSPVIISADTLLVAGPNFPELYPSFFRSTIIIEQDIWIAAWSTFSDEELELLRNE